MQIIEKAFTESLLLRNCKGVLKGFQTNFETFFLSICSNPTPVNYRVKKKRMYTSEWTNSTNLS